MTKSLLMIGALALASVPFASAKSYDITLSERAKAGDVQLAPGEYKLKVEGSTAVFKDTRTDKSFTAPVKVENAGTKFSETRIESKVEGDMQNIQAIDLGGSSTKLEFEQPAASNSQTSSGQSGQ